MARFSSRHYRAVSPPSDTAEDVRERNARHRAGKLAGADRLDGFPVITAENFDRANDYQEARFKFYYKLIMRGKEF